MKTINNLKAEQIRKSILQLAIQGKLVKQNPNDEPASELVKRIYEEKKKLISEGKIKKDKNESYIFKGDDNCYYEKIGKNEPVKLENLPFDIPGTWTYFKLESLTYPIGTKYNQIQSKEILKSGKWPVVSQSQNLIDGYSNDDDKVIIVNNNHPIIMFGDHTRNVKIINFSYIIGADGTKFFRPILINENYLYLLIKFISFKIKNKGYARHYSLLKQEYLPLPPLSEQQRIVDKINSIEPLIQEYDLYEQKLSSLELNFTDKLKKSILQYAIEGKLVKQDPNDEPASVLLDRIKIEKEKLIKEGKIKRDKNESYIYQGDDKNYYEKIGNNINKIDIPFDRNDIAWTKLKNIAFITKLAGFEYSQYIQPNLVNSGIPLFKGKNVQNSQVIYQFENYIPLEISNKLSRSQINRKCLLTPYVGTIGNVGIHDKTGTFHLGSNVGKIEIYNYSSLNVMEEYVFYYLKSFTGYYELTKFKKATAQESISIDAIRETIIPIYPLSIQEKIHHKIILINQLI